MIVLDASVVVALLTNGPSADFVSNEIASHEESFIAPHLIDLEVTSAIRRLTAAKLIDAHQGGQFLVALAGLPVERYSHTPFLNRIWQLRHNFTAYDAAYIALAEATDSVLYTCDQKLCKGHRARVVLFAA